ncbi:MAG: VWA domain-containing protein [Chitinophagaceae bacterium]|nr:MAG: VWA domain-containing protein [Chitinophagaceae bacterium]
MWKKFFVSATFLAVAMTGFAQREIRKVPKKYIEEPDGVVLTSATATDEKLPWVVCSDRTNNKTYKTWTGEETYKTMEFMEKFYVTDEKDDYVHIYKYDPLQREPTGYKLKQGAVDYGWAPKARLLLWMKGLMTPRRIAEKALPILTGITYKNKEEYARNSKHLKLFKTPDLSVESEKGINMFQFLFVYKRDEKSKTLLVGKGDRTFSDRVEHDVLGWIDERIAVPWGDRVCLDFNNGDGAVEERRQKGIKASLLATPEDAKEWQDGKSVAAVWDNDPYDRKRNSIEKRWPILGPVKDGIYKTGCVTDILDETGKEVMTEEQSANIKKEMHEMLIATRNVNVVFVIDGERGMGEYIAAVQNVIARVVKRRSEMGLGARDGEVTKYKFGAVIYRDELDNRCNGQELDVNKKGLTTDPDEVIKFIREQADVKGCQQRARALNKGLYTGIRMLASGAESKDETKVLVVLGSEIGRDGGEYSRENLIRLTAQYKIYTLAFQVSQGVGAVYDQYPMMFGGIIQAAIKQSAAANVNAGTRNLEKLPPPKFGEFGTAGYTVDYPKTVDLMGLVTFPPQKKTLTAVMVNEYIDSMLTVVENDIERKISNINQKIDGIGKKGIKLDQSVMRHLASVSDQLNEPELINKYYKDNFQFFIPGYVSLNRKGLNEDVMTRCLFMTQDEVINLIASIKRFLDDESTEEKRETVYNAAVMMLGSYLGDQKQARKNISEKKWTASQVFELATGLPSSNPIFSRPIDDYKDPQRVSAEEIQKLSKHFSEKFNALNGLVGDPRYKLDLSWGYFYWVPEKFLP